MFGTNVITLNNFSQFSEFFPTLIAFIILGFGCLIGCKLYRAYHHVKWEQDGVHSGRSMPIGKKSAFDADFDEGGKRGGRGRSEKKGKKKGKGKGKEAPNDNPVPVQHPDARVHEDRPLPDQQQKEPTTVEEEKPEGNKKKRNKKPKQGNPALDATTNGSSAVTNGSSSSSEKKQPNTESQELPEPDSGFEVVQKKSKRERKAKKEAKEEAVQAEMVKEQSKVAKQPAEEQPDVAVAESPVQQQEKSPKRGRKQNKKERAEERDEAVVKKDEPKEQAQEQSPKSQTQSPKSRPESPKSEIQSPKSRPESPKPEAQSPKSQTQSPKSRTESPKSLPESPKSQSESPKTQPKDRSPKKEAKEQPQEQTNFLPEKEQQRKEPKTPAKEGAKEEANQQPQDPSQKQQSQEAAQKKKRIRNKMKKQPIEENSEPAVRQSVGGAIFDAEEGQWTNEKGSKSKRGRKSKERRTGQTPFETDPDGIRDAELEKAINESLKSASQQEIDHVETISSGFKQAKQSRKKKEKDDASNLTETSKATTNGESQANGDATPTPEEKRDATPMQEEIPKKKNKRNKKKKQDEERAEEVNHSEKTNGNHAPIVSIVSGTPATPKKEPSGPTVTALALETVIDSPKKTPKKAPETITESPEKATEAPKKAAESMKKEVDAASNKGLEVPQSPKNEPTQSPKKSLKAQQPTEISFEQEQAQEGGFETVGKKKRNRNRNKNSADREETAASASPTSLMNMSKEGVHGEMAPHNSAPSKEGMSTDFDSDVILSKAESTARIPEHEHSGLHNFSSGFESIPSKISPKKIDSETHNENANTEKTHKKNKKKKYSNAKGADHRHEELVQEIKKSPLKESKKETVSAWETKESSASQPSASSQPSVSSQDRLLDLMLSTNLENHPCIDMDVRNVNVDTYNVTDTETIEIPVGLLLECHNLLPLVRRKQNKEVLIPEFIPMVAEIESKLKTLDHMRKQIEVVVSGSSSSSSTASGSTQLDAEQVVSCSSVSALASSNKSNSKKSIRAKNKAKAKHDEKKALMEAERLAAEEEKLSAAEGSLTALVGRLFKEKFLSKVIGSSGTANKKSIKENEQQNTAEQNNSDSTIGTVSSANGTPSSAGTLSTPLSSEGQQQIAELQKQIENISSEVEGNISLMRIEMFKGLEKEFLCQKYSFDHLEVASIPDLTFPMLSQITYWFDRRRMLTLDERYANLKENSSPKRKTDSKMGRWTTKLSREEVVYSAVAYTNEESFQDPEGNEVLSAVRDIEGKQAPKLTQKSFEKLSDTAKSARGHLGQKPIFIRPRGIDVTRLTTLEKSSEICGHIGLLKLVRKTSNSLKRENCARISKKELMKHKSKESCWICIDRKVYSVTPFLSLHPGGEELIVQAAGWDATGIFEFTHGEGLRYSLRILNQFFVGFLADDVVLESFPDTPEDQPSKEFLSILRKITSALHDGDEEYATGERYGGVRGGA